MTILDTIIAQKKIEVERAKKIKPIYTLENAVYFNRNCNSLSLELIQGHANGIIAEFKRKSPSKGIINGDVLPVEVVQGYAEAGVAAASILTDKDFFGGSLDDLIAVRNALLELPLLRKEFIVDEYQVIEAKASGADLILLIASCLNKNQVKNLASVARNLDLEVLLELHDESELDHVVDDINLVGINNRNLKTFAVDIDNALRMIEKLGDTYPCIAESGISTPEDILIFRNHGYKGYLIGENFMKHKNPSLACSQFIQELQGL